MLLQLRPTNDIHLRSMHKLISTTQLSPFHAVARDDSPYIVGRKLRNEVFDVLSLVELAQKRNEDALVQFVPL